MEEDPTLMDDLLMKIDILTMENNELENQFKDINEKCNLLKSQQYAIEGSNVEYKLSKIEEVDINFDLSSMIKLVYKDDLKEVNIVYNHFEPCGTVYIKGDFTNWEKCLLTKDKNSGAFKITLKLLNGFKYFYLFEVDGNEIYDFNQPYTENKYRKNQTNNFIIVEQESSDSKINNNNTTTSNITGENESLSSFKMDLDPEEYPNAHDKINTDNINIVDNTNISNSCSNKNTLDNNNISNVNFKDFCEDLESNKKSLENATKPEFVCLCPENELLTKIIEFSDNYSSREKILSAKREETLNNIKKHFDTKIKTINDFAKEKFESVFQHFKDRVAKVENALILIKELDTRTAMFRGIRLYDKNSVKVNIDLHIKHRMFEQIPFFNVVDKGKFFSVEQSASILDDYSKNTEILKIYYQTIIIGNNHNDEMDVDEHMGMGDEGEDDDLGYKPSYKFGPPDSENEIVPYKILPEGVDINQYNLVINNEVIKEVKTRDSGLCVFFEAILINNKNRKFSGLVSSSMMKVYTTLYSKDIVNLIHIHLNDTSEEIAVDSVFLEPNETAEQFREFKIDTLGKKLNYRIIFKDYKLNKIYYNLADNFIDEPKFEEIKITVGNIVKIRTDKTFQNYFAKVIDIPLGLLVRKDKENKDVAERLRSSDVVKEGYCVERHLHELPGFVEIQLMFNPNKTPFNDKKIKLSIPICNLIILDIKEQVEFEKIVAKEQILTETKQKQSLEALVGTVKSLEKYLDFKALSDEVNNFNEAKDLLKFFDEIKLESFKAIESDEEANKEIAYIKFAKEQIVANLQKHLRVLSLTKK